MVPSAGERGGLLLQHLERFADGSLINKSIGNMANSIHCQVIHLVVMFYSVSWALRRTITMRPGVLSLFFLLCSLFFTCRVLGQEDSAKAIRCQNGYKEYHYGIPFLYLQGTNYDVGLQYGTLLKSELTGMYDAFGKFKDNLMEKEIRYLPWYQRVLAHAFGGMVWRHKINTLADRLPADLEDQIRGAAEGSDLPESFFREIQVIVDLYSNRCEAIVIEKSGHTYHGHNLDQPMPLSLISQYPVVVNCSIQGKQKYTDIGFVSVLMTTTAFNESGISISENGNNNPLGFDRSTCGLYAEKMKIITNAHNLREVDSLVHTLTFPNGLIFTVCSSKEQQAVVCDCIGSLRAVTLVRHYQFAGNRTVSGILGKKSETIRSGHFHDTSREIQFAGIIDTAKPNMIDEIVSMLSNTDFYHYTDPLPVYLESLHNFETDQSVIFDLADSAVYFASGTHFAAWNRWLKYNYVTRDVSIYKEVDPKRDDHDVRRLSSLFEKVETCDWRDSANVRSLVDTIIESGIRNYFTLDFLSTTCLNYYHTPEQGGSFADTLIEKYPDVVTGYYGKGRALEAQNKLGEAIAEYVHALGAGIQCEYYQAETNEHLALAYDALGERNVAAAYAATALSLHRQYWIPDHLNERIQKLEKIKAGIE